MISFLEFMQILAFESLAVLSAYILTYMDHKKISEKMCEISQRAICSERVRLAKDFGTNMLYKYSKYSVQLNKYWKKSYENNWITRVMVDSADYIGRFISAKINGTLLEPYSTQWINACILCEVPDQSSPVAKLPSNLVVEKRSFSDQKRYKYIDLYQHSNHLVLSSADNPRRGLSKDDLGIFKNWCSLKDDYLEDDDRELLMILKSGGQYLSRVAISRTNPQNVTYHGFVEDNSDIFILSRMNVIISVEYTNPKMENSITLDIPRGFMNVGNQILSPAFVYRCLKYQNKPYYFDMNYTLKIMDSCTETYEMGSEEMVVFEKTGFRIVKI
jgi:hypothetical protein